MKRIRKTWLSIALTAALCFSAIPAIAAEPVSEIPETEVLEEVTGAAGTVLEAAAEEDTTELTLEEITLTENTSEDSEVGIDPAKSDESVLLSDNEEDAAKDGDSSGKQGTEEYSIEFGFNGPGSNISGNSDDTFYVDYMVPDGMQEGTDYVVQVSIDYQTQDGGEWLTFPSDAYQIRSFGPNRKEIAISYQKIPNGAAALTVKAQIAHPTDGMLVYTVAEQWIGIAYGKGGNDGDSDGDSSGDSSGGKNAPGDHTSSGNGFTITISGDAYNDPLLIDPIFRDGKKEFDIDILAPQGSVKDKDYEVLKDVGVFNGPSSPVNPVFTEGTEYTIEETATGYHVTVYGNKLPKDLSAFLIRVEIHNISDGNRTLMVRNDLMVNIQDPTYRYNQFPDVVAIKGETVGVNEDQGAFVVNQDYPNGTNLPCLITNISIESQTGSSVVSVPQLETDPSGEGRAWSFIPQNLGTAVMKVTYLDYQGKEQSYTFRVDVVSSRYDTYIEPVNGDVMGNPGETVVVSASTVYSEENRQSQDVTDQMLYRWYLEGDDQNYAVLQANGNRVSVKLGDLSEDEFGKNLMLHAAVYGKDKSGNPDYSTELSHATSPIIIQKDYIRLEPAISGLLISESETGKTVTFHLVHHVAGNEPVIMEGIHYRWNYDPSKVQITDVDGTVIGPVGNHGAYIDTNATTGGDCTFTITRKTEEFYSGIEIIAEWNQSPAGQYLSNYSSWFYIAPYSAPQISEFTDVSDPDKYYYNPVYWAYEKGITTGTSDTTFEPETICNRAQVVTFLWRLAGEPEPSKTGFFRDVAADKYFYKAVYWAAENGITTGTSATTFSPYEACTRGQVVTFLWRFRGQPKVAADGRFKDVKQGRYFYDAVYWALSAGVTTGTSATKFEPDKPCTRAQTVTFLFRTAGE